ncbi:MAG: hypothetical protein H6727_10345, partial [Myxococcales bacterium]|nr:hypothetical protein [Myxococcales bacterium]
AGLGAGSILSQPVTSQMRRARLVRNLLLFVVASASIAASWFFLPKTAGSWRSFVGPAAKVEHRVLTRFQEAAQQFHDNKISPKQFALVLEKELLPPWEKMIADGEKVSTRHLSFSQERKLDKVLESLRLRAASWRSLRLYLLTGKREHLEKSLREKRRADGVPNDDPRSKHPELFRSTASPAPRKQPTPSPTSAPIQRTTPSAPLVPVPQRRSVSTPSSRPSTSLPSATSLPAVR